MKKKLILSLICIGLISIGASTIFANKSKQVKLYSNPNTSYLQIITNPTNSKMNEEISKIVISPKDSQMDKELANKAIDFIKIGSFNQAKDYTKGIENSTLKNDLFNLINLEENAQEKNNIGQLTSSAGISNDIFTNCEYPGISNEAVKQSMPYSKLMVPKDSVDSVIRYYNPNILNQKTFIKYYNEVVKANKSDKQVNYILRDIYNPNYGISMSNHSNEFNEFNYGNLNPNNYVVLNNNLMYAGITKNGDIKSYSSVTNKPVQFILKK